MNRNIAITYVRFIQTKGGRWRPIFVIKETNDKLIFFNITTKYENKSDYIRKWYFEILDYEFTGLNKHSWIDTYKVYSLSKDLAKVNFIGKLSDNDLHKLSLFIRKNQQNQYK